MRRLWHWWRARNDQVGTVTWYYNTTKGLHSAITHLGHCADIRGCQPVELPVDRRGHILPVGFPDGRVH